MSWFKRLKSGLSKTSLKLSDGITKIFLHKKLDQKVLDDLEDLLIASDMGVSVANSIVEKISKEKFDKEITDEKIKQSLIEIIVEDLKPIAQPLLFKTAPQVILMCGVNGNGKTTTAGKIALKFKKSGKKVMLVACDTFRAAAIEQLEVWADRAECTFVKSEQNSDPASVAYKALERAKQEDIDVVVIDTAGRLHNKKNLMEELAKIIRVLKKSEPDAPHDTLLVLDATTGQNALTQVETFKEAANISGLILTKLDGTAKGGVLLAIAKKYKLPIHAVGVGESIDDLNEFTPEEFAKALIG
jgi:fused signal recognition particle receptor